MKYDTTKQKASNHTDFDDGLGGSRTRMKNAINAHG